MDHEVDERQEICSNETHEFPVCNIRRFEMIKYSFGDDEEYVAVKEDEYNDLTSTSKDACRAYQEIFRMMDEGWMLCQYGVFQTDPYLDTFIDLRQKNEHHDQILDRRRSIRWALLVVEYVKKQDEDARFMMLLPVGTHLIFIAYDTILAAAVDDCVRHMELRYYAQCLIIDEDFIKRSRSTLREEGGLSSSSQKEIVGGNKNKGWSRWTLWRSPSAECASVVSSSTKGVKNENGGRLSTSGSADVNCRLVLLSLLWLELNQRISQLLRKIGLLFVFIWFSALLCRKKGPQDEETKD
nr:hypothetical protein [Tanacetum cinerariifolium]